MKSKAAGVIGLVVLAAAVFAVSVLLRPDALFFDRVAEAPAPRPQGEPRLAGAFHDAGHAGAGRAVLRVAPDGTRTLRFTDFRVDNGPDLVVLMAAAPDAPDTQAVEAAETVSLGPLKGNVGDQTYAVPADLDLARFRTVVVWCRRFSVNFAAAPLRPVGF